MRKSLSLAAAISLASLSFAGPSALAAPMNGFDPALAKTSDAAKDIDSARLICGPYAGRRWVPGYGNWRPWRFGPWAPGFGYWRAWPWGPYGAYRPWPRRYGWRGYYRPYW
jgi:hypothetical protein